MVENTSRSEFMPGNAMNLKMLATECENGFGDENSTDDVIGKRATHFSFVDFEQFV